MRRDVTLCAVPLLLWPAASLAAKVDVYALVGGKVVTVSGSTIEKGTVILRDGVIEAVGAKVPVPVDARVIDAQGLTITPGLIDAFGGLGLPPPARSTGTSTGAGPAPAPAAPPASPLLPAARAIDKVRASDALKARDAGLTTALAIPRTGVLPGQSVLLNLAGTRPEQMALKQPAAMHLHLATATRTYPTSLMGTMAYARQQLLDAARYRDEWAAYERAPAGKKRPRYDAGLAAWGDVLARRQMLVVTASRENDIRRALALGDELRIRVGIADARRAFKLAGLLKARQAPLFVSVDFDPLRPVTGGGDEEREARQIEEAQKNPAELHKAGVPFALCSAFGPAFLAGVRKAIEAGLPREAALRALTLDAARALGVADRTGSLEAGKIANVVAWTGDPLDRRAKVKLVFVDGQLHEPRGEPERDRGGGGGDDADKPEADPVAASGGDEGGGEGAENRGGVEEVAP
jgi:imidazolonepropionase-like amidohydrolase